MEYLIDALISIGKILAGVAFVGLLELAIWLVPMLALWLLLEFLSGIELIGLYIAKSVRKLLGPELMGPSPSYEDPASPNARPEAPRDRAIRLASMYGFQ